MGAFLSTLAPARLASIPNFVNALESQRPDTAAIFHLALFEAALQANGARNEEFSSVFTLYRTASSAGDLNFTTKALQGVARWIFANPEISLQALNRIPRPLFAATGLEGFEKGMQTFLPLKTEVDGAMASLSLGVSHTASRNRPKTSRALCSDPDDKKGEEPALSLMIEELLDERRNELKMIFGSHKQSVEKRIEAIEEFEVLTTSRDVEESIEALLELQYEYLLDELPYEDLPVRTHALAAIIHLLRQNQIHDDVKKDILEKVLRLSRFTKVTLVHLEKDWPVEDPHRIAPYLIDLNRPWRLLIGEALSELVEQIKFDPESLKDRKLQNRIDRARLHLHEKELAIQERLLIHKPRPYRLSLLERIHERPALHIMVKGPLYVAMVLSFPFFLAWGPLLPALALYLLYPKNRRFRQDASGLQQYRDLYLRLGIRPEAESLLQPIPSQPKQLAAGEPAPKKGEPDPDGEK